MSDVYSFGILVWEIFHDGEKPYDEMEIGDIDKKVRKGMRPKFKHNVPKEIAALINDHSFPSEPEERYTMNVMVKVLQVFQKKQINSLDQHSTENLTANSKSGKIIAKKLSKTKSKSRKRSDDR